MLLIWGFIFMKTTLCYVFTANSLTLAEFEISIHSFAEHNHFNTDVVVYTDHPELVKYRTRRMSHSNLNFIIKGLIHFDGFLEDISTNKSCVDYSATMIDRDHAENSITHLEYLEIVSSKMLGILDCIKKYDIVISQDIDTVYYNTISDIVTSVAKSKYALCGMFNTTKSSRKENTKIPSADIGCMIFNSNNLPDNLEERFYEFLKNYDSGEFNNFDELFVGSILTEFPSLFFPELNFCSTGWSDNFVDKKFRCLHIHNSLISRKHADNNYFRANATNMIFFPDYLCFADKYNVKTEGVTFSAWIMKEIKKSLKHDKIDIETYFNRVIDESIKTTELFKERLEWWKIMTYV